MSSVERYGQPGDRCDFCGLFFLGHVHLCESIVPVVTVCDRCGTSVYDERHACYTAAKVNDAVKAPSHYCDGRQYEPRKVIRDWGLSWEIGSAVKYLARAGRKDKDKQVEDLRKAIEFIQFEIEGLEAKK